MFPRGQAAAHLPQSMHLRMTRVTVPDFVSRLRAPVGHTFTHSGLSQCMHMSGSADDLPDKPQTVTAELWDEKRPALWNEQMRLAASASKTRFGPDDNMLTHVGTSWTYMPFSPPARTRMDFLGSHFSSFRAKSSGLRLAGQYFTHLPQRRQEAVSFCLQRFVNRSLGGVFPHLGKDQQPKGTGESIRFRQVAGTAGLTYKAFKTRGQPDGVFYPFMRSFHIQGFERLRQAFQILWNRKKCRLYGRKLSGDR